MKDTKYFNHYGSKLKACIVWDKNSLTSGPDDPHFGTDKEGQHAILHITDQYGNIKSSLKVPDSEYNHKTVYLMEQVLTLINGG